MLVAIVEDRPESANTIKLAGVLDEHNPLDEIVEKLHAGVATINLSGVTKVCARGARDWAAWLESLVANGVTPRLVACSPAFVAYLNAEPTFRGAVFVKSVCVPYVCLRCHLPQLQPIEVDDIGESHEAPVCSCDHCAGELAFDGPPDYFDFLDTPPPELARGSRARIELGD
jgi:hypothetical protein